MKVTDKEKKDDLYIRPESVVLYCSPEGVICDSPDEGESEDVEYEDWG